ncbi:MAG: ATP-binding protein [Methylobacterium sp.]|nr:ATP-binding protein [Methylobacterium sp.]
MTETQSTLPGLNVLLMGPTGTGKTHSIGTLVDSGIEVFFLAIEPGLEALFGYWRDRGKDIPPNLHWHSLQRPSAGFDELLSSAEKISNLTMDSLTKIQDPNKRKHDQFINLLKALADFPDDRTGKKFGPVDSWTTDRVLVIDGLSGISEAAMALVVGGKATKTQPEWGVAQDTVFKLINKLTNDSKCHFVLLAHIDRETDQILGGVKLMVATLGVKLAPKLPPMFSDTILTVRNADKWTWDTASALADVKTRNLPIKSDNAPDFKTILAKWVARGGQFAKAG